MNDDGVSNKIVSENSLNMLGWPTGHTIETAKANAQQEDLTLCTPHSSTLDRNAKYLGAGECATSVANVLQPMC